MYSRRLFDSRTYHLKPLHGRTCTAPRFKKGATCILEWLHSNEWLLERRFTACGACSGHAGGILDTLLLRIRPDRSTALNHREPVRDRVSIISQSSYVRNWGSQAGQAATRFAPKGVSVGSGITGAGFGGVGCRGFGFRVSGFGFRVPGPGRVQDLGI